MDSVSTGAVTIMKAMTAAAAAAAAPSKTGITNLTTNSTPSWARVSMENGRINLQFIRRSKKIESFLVHCSTKPNTDRGNATEDNFTIDPSSSSRNQEQEISGSTQKNPSSSTSSSSSFSRGLIFGLGTENSWDSGEIGCPVVKRYLSDEEERWYMWYYGRSNNSEKSPIGNDDSVGLAVSSNGIHWERSGTCAKSGSDVGLVMNCSKDWWAFDTKAIRPSEVVIMSSSKVRVNDSLYWLYYTGCNSTENVEYLNNSLKFNEESRRVLDFDKIEKSLPGLAMSRDGRHWARIEGEHHSGALFDVGKEGEWDSLFIASPQVVFHGTGDLRMYYHSYDVEKGKFAIGIARSRDGIKWLKLGKIVGIFDEENGGMNGNVVRDRKDGKYIMAYEGIGRDGKRSIGMAVSEDGLKNWMRFGDGFAVLKPPSSENEKGWDCEGVGSPCLVQMDGEEDEWRLYYRGIGKDGKTGIGMAVSKGTDISMFERWTGFHL